MLCGGFRGKYGCGGVGCYHYYLYVVVAAAIISYSNIQRFTHQSIEIDSAHVLN